MIIGGLKLPGMDRGFGRGYEDLAKKTGAYLIPNIFADIVDKSDLMSDPIHPNNDGYRIIARRFHQALMKVEKSNRGTLAETHAVTLAWDNVPNATSYNIYWRDKPGVTKKNGTKIKNATNPYELRGLTKGKKYYFVVTAVNSAGESEASEEFSFTVER